MKTILSLLLFFSLQVSAQELSLDSFPSTKLVESTDIVHIETTAVNKDGTTAPIPGDIIGLEYAPAGDFKVNINNCKSFKGERFTLMNCTVKKYLDTLTDVVDNPQVAALSTAFVADGELYNKIGYYVGCDKYPSDDYKVIVNNGNDVRYWNSLNCTIK